MYKQIESLESNKPYWINYEYPKNIFHWFYIRSYKDIWNFLDKRNNRLQKEKRN